MWSRELFKNYCSILIIVETCAFLIIILNVYLLIVVEHSSEQKQLKKLPRFWTNTGFCPLGDVSKYLLNNDTRIHLNLVGALPNHGIDTIRIHWLLDLLDVKFEDNNYNGSPIYNFTKLDTVVSWVNEAGLSLGFEFMGNPNNLFYNKTDKMKMLLWEDLSIRIAGRFKEIYGINKLLNWKFETWNEPDLKNYNKLNFTSDNYLQYALALNKGLKYVDKNIKLRGPAGLFKDKSKHPICWDALKFCNDYLENCPFDILTFHRKGNGEPSQVAIGGKNLLSEIFSEYPKLSNHPISNDEADPIAGWSTPRKFQSDIQYAADLVKIVLEHWAMKLETKEFVNLESISHDNAFMSYHPYEFNQRTLFARFQMNNSRVPYSQFVAKPVYVALGMLGHLGEYAEEPVFDNNLSYLTTTSGSSDDFYLAIIVASTESTYSSKTELNFKIYLPDIKKNQQLSLCVEALETNETNPIELWNSYGMPSYPNTNEREWMRRIQGPKVFENRVILSEEKILKIKYNLNAPWVGLIRICNLDRKKLTEPKNIRILKLTKGEVLIFWEYYGDNNCIKTFEIKFKPMKNENILDTNMNLKKDKSWIPISRGWRVPFRYFQYKQEGKGIIGYYKIRAVHISGKSSAFSEEVYFNGDNVI
ncbi:alpha-L-iduronidase [Condylostylus longicornis]|uniref:alpha-L-iduronidase n=1 Tax=Condylostylus longicornis TaxID=2530218 RepID=UPI00244D9FC6|nr:alpha-L-iduronidase [Condylostylus longicornis]